MTHEEKDNSSPRSSDQPLSGTTLKVYRYLYTFGKPLGIHEVQRGLNLSSSSVASYHLRKLLAMGLAKQEEETQRYYVDRVIFENMIRFRRSLIPVQVGYLAFFASALVILVFLFSPKALNGAYVFSVLVIAIACGVFAYQTIKSLSRRSI